MNNFFFFCLIFKEESVTHSSTVSGSLYPEHWYPPQCCMDFVFGWFIIYCLIKQSLLFLSWMATLLYSSHTHTLFNNPPVFVSHLLASNPHVLAVVFLWSLVSLCLLVTVYFYIYMYIYMKCWKFSGPVFKILCPDLRPSYRGCLTNKCR